MSGFLVDEKFIAEHREMMRWYRAQEKRQALDGKGQRYRKPQELIPFVTTGTLNPSDTTADIVVRARRLHGDNYGVAQVVAMGAADSSGYFTLTANGVTSGQITVNTDDIAFQSEMDSLYGAGNTTVGIGNGTWHIAYIGNLYGTIPPLMTVDTSNMGGSEIVSIKRTKFNVVASEIELFEFLPSRIGSYIEIGTIGYAYQFPGLGYGIINYVDKDILDGSTLPLLCKTDAAISKGNSGTLSIWTGEAGSESDSGDNIVATNKFADLAISKWAWVESNGEAYYITAGEC